MNINLLRDKLSHFFLDKRTRQSRDIIEDFQKSNKNYVEIASNMVDSIPLVESDTFVSKNVYNDIEFFANYSNDAKSRTIFDTYTDLNLQGGSALAKRVLSLPQSDKALLQNRSNVLQTFENKWVDEDKIYFQAMKDNEASVLWLFEQQEKHVEDLFNILYFRFAFLRGLNNSPSLLGFYNIYRILISPLIGILSPIVYVLIPFLVITWKLKIPISFKDYIKFFFNTLLSSQDFFFSTPSNMKYVRFISYVFSLIFYFQGMFNSVEISRTLYKICSFIITKFNGVVRYVKASNHLISKYWDDNIIGTFIKPNEIFKEANIESSYVGKLRDVRFSIFSNFGRQLHDYKYISKDLITSLLSKSYVLDFMFATCTYRKKNGYSFASYTDNVQPYVLLQGARHPCLEHDVVKNDFELKDRNVIITGPNAGGKSTFIKTFITCIILSQTVCISPSDVCELTPFKNIVSQINIPDCKGKESLFEAEMHRCQENLSLLKRDGEQRTIIVMDEIFNSTNPIEGISGAYAIAKQISNYTNCLLIFTTHYVYLTKLEKVTKRFVNYRMNVIIEDDVIKFPYKLQRGVSKQYIALELLRKNGFDQDILDEALQIKKKLTT